jgi:phasin
MSDPLTLEKVVKPKPAHPHAPKSAFEVPEFKVPNLELPAAIRELVEKGGAQAKDNCEKIRTVTEEMSDVVEATFANAAKGVTNYGLKVLEMTRANTTASFEFVGKLIGATSPTEAVEVATAHARQQFDASSKQYKELLALAEKITTEAAEPIKASMSKAFTQNA